MQYSEQEIDVMRRHKAEGIALARETAIRRGHRLHPKVAALKLKRCLG